MLLEALGLTNKQERIWKDELERRGWTQAQGKPRELAGWVETYSRHQGVDFRIVQAGNVSEYAWNPRSFDPRAGEVAKCRFLMNFSEGVSDSYLMEAIQSNLGLPALILASAIRDYWFEADVLTQADGGRVALSGEMLVILNEPEVLLRNKGGLATVEELKSRLQLKDDEFRDAFPDAPPDRLVSNTVVLDLAMHSPRIDEVWVSNLVAEMGNVVPLTRIAEEIGLITLAIPAGEAIEMAKRVCSVLRDRYFPGSDPAIMEVNDDQLSVGNIAEVVDAHIRRIVEYQTAWNNHAESLEGDLDTLGAGIEEREQKLEQIEVDTELSDAELRGRVIQAAMLQAYKDALFHTNRLDTA